MKPKPVVFLLPDSLRQVLSEFSIVRPVRTSSDGRFLATSVSVRSKRQADVPFGQAPTTEEAELFYNVTVFGHQLHLRLQANTRLVAPGATMEWWEESGGRSSRPIGDMRCFYTGEVSNAEDTSVAISNCDGLVGVPTPP